VCIDVSSVQVCHSLFPPLGELAPQGGPRRKGDGTGQSLAKQESTPRVTGGLPESVASFLVELARALQRSGMYPPGHPAREKTAGTVCESFSTLAATVGKVRLEIAPDHLIFGETATDPAQTVLAGMAARLYQHHLLSITILPGLEQSELADLLGIVLRIGCTDARGEAEDAMIPGD